MFGCMGVGVFDYFGWSEGVGDGIGVELELNGWVGEGTARVAIIVGLLTMVECMGGLVMGCMFVSAHGL